MKALDELKAALEAVRDGFDAGGSELRAFIVAAHERLPAVLDGIEAERKAWARYAAALDYPAEAAGHREVQETKRVLLALGVDVDALTADA